MNRNAFVVGLVAVGVLAVVALVVVAATNTVQDDVCSAAYRECSAMAAGLIGTVDCRVEVYHCRSAGHFEFPDGTVRKFPTSSADGGED